VPRVAIGVREAREDIIKEVIKIRAWRLAFSVNRAGI
jgi:hypothetical protein